MDENFDEGDDEFMDEMPPERPRNWCSIFVSLSIIIFVLLMVTLAAALLIPLQKPPFVGRRLRIDDINNRRFVAGSLASQWLSDFELAFVSSKGDLVVLDIQSQLEEVLINHITLRHLEAREFSISSNRRFVLLVHDIVLERLFKRTALYTVYDLKKNFYYSLKLTSDPISQPRFQHVQWLRSWKSGKSSENIQRNATEELGQKEKLASAFSTDNSDKDDQKFDNQKFAESFINKREAPSSSSMAADAPTVDRKGRRGSELVVVYQNDVYLLKKPNGALKRLTTDGVVDSIFNGVPDLLYEEIMLTSSTLSINANSSLLAMASFNSTEVAEIPVLHYRDEEEGKRQDRPSVKMLKYATVTSSLPHVTLWVYDLTSLRRKELVPPIPIEGIFYLLDFGWASKDEIWASWSSRNQSLAVLAKCSGPGWECSLVHVNQNTKGPSPVQRGARWLGNLALFPWPVPVADGSYHNHIAIVGGTGKKHAPLPTWNYDVNDVVVLDSERQLVYFMGSRLSDGSFASQLYRVSLEQSSPSEVRCISCKIGCPRVTSSINSDLSHAVVTCVGTHLPSMHLIDLRTAQVDVILRQDVLRDSFSDVALPEYIRRDISLSPGVHASVLLTLPPGFRIDDDSLLYPLIIQTLGTEKFNERDDTLRLGWVEYLPSAQHIAHAQLQLWGVDPSIYMSTNQMAKHLEIIISVFVSDYTFLNSEEVYIWGWGSGASIGMQLAMTEGFHVRCVAAVNPIADWRMYSSYMAERHLGPLNSPGSEKLYQESGVKLDTLNVFNQTQLLIVQSELDPLSQHSSRIVQKLIEIDVQFRHVVYPDSSATLRGNRLHLLKVMEKFFINEDCIVAPSVDNIIQL